MKPEQSGKKAGRFAQHVRVVKQVRDEPRRIMRLLRDWLLRLWAARGGGFYGLGVVVTFLVLEVRMLLGDVSGSDSVADFLVGELLEYVFRLGFLSFLNGFVALLWPAFLLEWLGAWGIAVLVCAYLTFERMLRPTVEAWFPELREARERRIEHKREKRRRKEEKRAGRRP